MSTVAPELKIRIESAWRRSADLHALAAETIARSREAAARPSANHRNERIGHPEAEVAGLRRALESRAVIDMAKGIIIGRTGCGPEQAFRLLVAQSQTENRKVREVAEDLARQNVRQPADKSLRTVG